MGGMRFSAYVSRMTLVHLGPVIGCSFLVCRFTFLLIKMGLVFVPGVVTRNNSLLKEAEVQSPKKLHATATLDGQSNLISGFDTAFCRGMLPVSLAQKKFVQYFSHEQIEVRQQVTIMK